RESRRSLALTCWHRFPLWAWAIRVREAERQSEHCHSSSTSPLLLLPPLQATHTGHSLSFSSSASPLLPSGTLASLLLLLLAPVEMRLSLSRPGCFLCDVSSLFCVFWSPYSGSQLAFFS